MGGVRHATLQDAFHAACSSDGWYDEGCWMWTKGVTEKHPYGRLCWNGKVYQPHRVAHELFRGPIPDGHVVMHLCDTPGCVRVGHLATGTQGENIRDCQKKGRHPNPGHPWGCKGRPSK